MTVVSYNVKIRMACPQEPTPDFYRKATDRSTHRSWGGDYNYPSRSKAALVQLKIKLVKVQTQHVRTVIESSVGYPGDYENIVLLGVGSGKEAIWTREVFPNAYIAAYETDPRHEMDHLPAYCDVLGIELQFKASGDMRNMHVITPKLSAEKSLVVCRNPHILMSSKNETLDLQMIVTVSAWMNYCAENKVDGLFTFATDIERNAVLDYLDKTYKRRVSSYTNFYNDVVVERDKIKAASDQFISVVR